MGIMAKNFRSLFQVLAFLLVLAGSVAAQNQGGDLGLGNGGTVLIGRVNEAGTALASGDGKANYIALTKSGRVIVTSDSSTLLGQSTMPVSGASGLNGGLTNINGTFQVGTDTIEALSSVTVLNLTAHVARVGDFIIPTGGTAGNINVAIPICSVTTNTVTLCYPLPSLPSTDAISIRRTLPLFVPQEDSAHVSGDSGIMMMGVIDTTASSGFGGSNGDYTPQAFNATGAAYVNIDSNSQVSSVRGILKLEDSAASDLGAGVYPMFIAEDPITSDVNATNDNAVPKVDRGGRVITTSAPGGELIVGCNTAVTTATTGSMIAAIASNFSYITSWDCTNTGATASRVILEDGDGTDLANGFLPATSGYFNQTLTSPVRTNVVNRAIQVNVLTSGSSTICCARGYKSVI